MPTSPLTHPEPGEYASFYAPYMDKVPERDLLPALTGQLDDLIPLLASISEDLGGHRYAPGKWSIRELVGHLSDAERVFAYRALRFSRADKTDLPGFDEDHFVAHSGYDLRSLADLREEFRLLRLANLRLFEGMTPEMTARIGTANGHPISVRALACAMVGHVRHHVGTLKERYL
jgi:hypothetical protein